MAHIIPETDTFSPTVTIPDDGDVANAASVNGAFTEIADRSRYLYNRQILSYPENVASASALYVAAGVPPTRAVVETLVTGVGNIGFSTALDFAIEDLELDDVIKVTGSIQIDPTSIVGPPDSLFLGIAATSTKLPGWMHSINPGLAPNLGIQVNICATILVIAPMVPTFQLQLGIDAVAVGASIDIMRPYNLLIERFRK